MKKQVLFEKADGLSNILCFDPAVWLGTSMSKALVSMWLHCDPAVRGDEKEPRTLPPPRTLGLESRREIILEMKNHISCSKYPLDALSLFTHLASLGTENLEWREEL